MSLSLLLLEEDVPLLLLPLLVVDVSLSEEELELELDEVSLDEELGDRRRRFLRLFSPSEVSAAGGALGCPPLKSSGTSDASRNLDRAYNGMEDEGGEVAAGT